MEARSDHRDTAIAIVNGAVGDRLEEAGSSLATRLQLRFGLEHAENPPAQAPRRVCLFVHGLMGTEHNWTFWSRRGEELDYPSALRGARDVMPVYVRYNTGRHISTNGRALAEILEGVLAEWPGLEELSIVAHSMGGLVTRSACHYGMEADHAWTDRLARVFLLGVPTHGTSFEQLAHVAAFTLDSIWNPWTKIVGKAMNLRSAGIKDLRHGFVLDEDWRNRDVDKLRLAAPRRPHAVPSARWHVVTGSLGRADGLASRLLGDGAVPRRSAEGKGFGTPGPGLLGHAELRRFEHTSHARLLGDPAVLEQLLAWWPED